VIRSVPKELVHSLLRQPETGMGWQLVDVEHARGTPERMIAVNASFLASGWSELRNLARAEGRLSESVLFKAARNAAPAEIKAIRVVRPARMVTEMKSRGAAAPAPAADAPETFTEKDDQFRRFSAFENDRRVTSDNGLLPGTYGTTAKDADAHVHTGMDAVRRYALPNPAPAKYEFVIRPPERTRIKEGIVEPANNQPGGGVEIIFVEGSPPDTVTRGRTLPDT